MNEYDIIEAINYWKNKYLDEGDKLYERKYKFFIWDEYWNY